MSDGSAGMQMLVAGSNVSPTAHFSAVAVGVIMKTPTVNTANDPIAATAELRFQDPHRITP
ncbi:hypothetical protein B1R94_02685 [Mycolicibacterium litorale]|nr:hypothetical protein B1R94_02685 [Mycolicibacterium litorale]